jgi:hypothetical protein
MQAIQMSTWSTNGGSSPLGTKMQGPTAGFEHEMEQKCKNQQRVLNMPAFNLMEAF